MHKEIRERIRELEIHVLEKRRQITSIHKDFDEGRFDSWQREERVKNCEAQIRESEEEIANLKDQLERGEVLDNYSVKHTFRGKTGHETYEMFREVMHQAFETLKVVAQNRVPGQQFIQNVEEVTKPPIFNDGGRSPEYPDLAPFEPWVNVENTYIWFNGEFKSQEARAFIIALALFGGIAQKDIFNVFNDIKKILDIRSDPRPDEAFNSPIADLIDVADGEFTEYERLTNAGHVKTTAINFKDGRAAALIILMLCRYYHQKELPRLLEFLAKVAYLGNTGALRERAAIALGMLGQIEFEWVQSPYLNNWAKQPKEMMIGRYAINTILFSIHQPGGKFNDNVFTLVRHWASVPWNFRLWLTAAICCSRLGIIDPDNTVPILKRLIAHDHIELIDPLIYSVSYIFQGLDENRILRLLHHFSDWITSGDETLQLGSILIIIGWMHITLRRDFRRLIIPALERGQEIDFWNLPVEYKGNNPQEFRKDYICTLSDILGTGLTLSPIVAREINLLLREFILIAEYRTKYRPLVRDVYTDLCCNRKFKFLVRQRLLGTLEQLNTAPKFEKYTFTKELLIFVRQRFRDE